MLYSCIRPAVVSLHPVPFPRVLAAESSLHLPRPLRMSSAPAPPAATTAAGASSNGEAAKPDFTVQYVVVRRDLWTDKQWPLGSVIAQVRTREPASASDRLVIDGSIVSNRRATLRLLRSGLARRTG